MDQTVKITNTGIITQDQTQTELVNQKTTEIVHIQTLERDTKSFDSCFKILNNFSQTFEFLTPKKRELYCSHEIMLRTNLFHTYSYYKFIQHHYMTNTPSQNPPHIFTFINSKYPSPYFLNLTYCKKIFKIKGILRTTILRQMYIFCPLTKSLDIEDSRPLINFHEYIQPIKVHTLKYIHKTKYNPKLNNLIQNTPYEFSLKKEEHNTILWPLLQKNYVIRMLAKFLTSSDEGRKNIPNIFFANENPL